VQIFREESGGVDSREASRLAMRRDFDRAKRHFLHEYLHFFTGDFLRQGNRREGRQLLDRAGSKSDIERHRIKFKF